MNFKKIQKSTLMVMLIGVSMPTQAFWGQETFTRWASNAASYVKDIYEQPGEHKGALGVGAAATIAAALAYIYWPKKDNASTSDNRLQEVPSSEDGDEGYASQDEPIEQYVPSQGTDPSVFFPRLPSEKHNEAALIDEVVSEGEEIEEDLGAGVFTPEEQRGLEKEGFVRHSDEMAVNLEASEPVQPSTRSVPAQSDVPAAAGALNPEEAQSGWSQTDIEGIKGVGHLKSILAEKRFKPEEQDYALIGAYIQYVLTHQAENQSVFERLQRSANRKEFVRDLIWYWEALARMRNQKFTEGTYVVYDPSKKIYDFIARKGGLYKRPSSHFDVYAAVYNKELKEIQPNMTQKGFELQYPLLNKEQLGLDFDDRSLPDEKGTLLIGKLKHDASVFFVKPENYSCQVVPQGLSVASTSKVASDTVMHGCEFVVAQVRKKAQKLSDSPVKEWLHESLGFDDDPDWRKERIPSDLIKQYQSLLQKAGLCEEDQNRLVREAAAYGIARMARHAFTTLRRLGDDTELEGFKQALQGYDYIGLRFGREVIIATDRPGLRMIYNQLLKNPRLMNKKSDDEVKKHYRWSPQLLLPKQVALGIKQIDSSVSDELIKQGGPPAYKDMLNVQDAQKVFQYLHDHKLL